MERQLHNEGSAFALLAFHADGAAVQQHQLVHDAQPQAGAALFAAAGLVYSVKAVENMGQVFPSRPCRCRFTLMMPPFWVYLTAFSIRL